MATTTPTIRGPVEVQGDTDVLVAPAVRGTTVRAGVEPRRPSLLDRLVRTDRAIAPAIARLGLAGVMLPHALQKLGTWFGGHGLRATHHAFVTMMGVPSPLAALAIATEILCTFALVLGLVTRVAALGIIAVMLGAISFVHLPNGFFMNWSGQQAGEGYEYHLLAIALALVCVVAGGGMVSVDRALTIRRRQVTTREPLGR